ncbi:MAG: RdgB/HAM1 family non-canonical purine NTP pyrophosphatase [Nitrospinota bacterium]|nr:RdgB/HAM1 family non-canonical purine NTP pyrophosphatase [Nitrospinota bacterium]
MNKNSIWKDVKFVTGNPNKVREAGQILGMFLDHYDVEGLIEIQTGDLEELVRHKAQQAYDAIGGPVLVEDSGLIFSAWNGLPGALIKWFESTVGYEGLIKMLSPFENREAKALCYVAVYDGRTMTMVKGEVKGTVADRVRGSNGFGWDVLFIPEDNPRTYAEMTTDEKNAISHRNRAFQNLKKVVEAG